MSICSGLDEGDHIRNDKVLQRVLFSIGLTLAVLREWMRVVSKLREYEQKKVKYEGRHEGEGRLTQNEEEKMQINMGLETVLIN